MKCPALQGGVSSTAEDPLRHSQGHGQLDEVPAHIAVRLRFGLTVLAYPAAWKVVAGSGMLGQNMSFGNPPSLPFAFRLPSGSPWSVAGIVAAPCTEDITATLRAFSSIEPAFQQVSNLPGPYLCFNGSSCCSPSDKRPCG